MMLAGHIMNAVYDAGGMARHIRNAVYDAGRTHYERCL